MQMWEKRLGWGGGMRGGKKDSLSFIKQAAHILLPWLPHITIEFNDWIY